MTIRRPAGMLRRLHPMLPPHMSLRRLLLSLFLLFSVGPASAAIYHLSGRVTQLDLLTPTAGADVALYAPGFPLPTLVTRTATSPTGHYTLTADCDDHCFLVASLDPYFPEQQYLPATPGAAQINFALARPGMISGQVSAGIPLGNEVYVMACRDISGQGDYFECLDDLIDAQGLYDIGRLRPGNYRVCTYGPSSSLRMQCYDHQDSPATLGMQQFEIVVLGDGEVRNAVDFDLAPGATIGGHVRDALTNQPVSAQIEIHDAYGQMISIFDGDGDYRTGGLAPGTYYIVASTTFGINTIAPSRHLYGVGPCHTNCMITEGTPITLAAGETLAGIDFAITPGAIVRGTVRDATTQQPLAGVRVRQLHLFNGLIPSHIETVTATDGSYRLYASPGLPFRLHTDGTADAVGVIWPDRPCPRDCDWASGELLAVEQGGDETYDFALARGGTLSGQTTAVTPGPIRLSLFSAATGAAIWQHTIDASGSYVTPPVLPGTYFLTADGNGACEAYSGHPCVSSGPQTFGTPITVSAGQATNGIDFVLDGDRIFRSRFEN
ncbi:carboxypeptidase regulatory-like domain-containing protein [Tahibacter sp.]|uniref:MSCRAMM family protein n=1 Tax=Tahibacter sp. TaxID=2056211 RepID=UPI0028C4A557|nr:carboxypeptidase regulatory-like domain-containing protein [Tahibacter sp.]